MNSFSGTSHCFSLWLSFVLGATVKCKLIIVYHKLPNNLRDAKIKININESLKGVSFERSSLFTLFSVGQFRRN